MAEESKNNIDYKIVSGWIDKGIWRMKDQKSQAFINSGNLGRADNYLLKSVIYEENFSSFLYIEILKRRYKDLNCLEKAVQEI